MGYSIEMEKFWTISTKNNDFFSLIIKNAKKRVFYKFKNFYYAKCPCGGKYCFISMHKDERFFFDKNGLTVLYRGSSGLSSFNQIHSCKAHFFIKKGKTIPAKNNTVPLKF